MRRKTLVSWSSGKDSAWTLHVLREDPSIEIVGVFCTLNEKFNRVAVHGVRAELLQQQAKNIDLPLHIVGIPYPCTNDQYINVMRSFILEAKASGIECIAFGDLFLRNVREYREKLLEGTGITPLFPLWGISTKSLSREMILKGLKAIITSLDPRQIAIEFAGRVYDESFLNDISAQVDPCGENGEFHSFAFDGPMFQNPIQIMLGETIVHDGICFTDLLPL